MCIKNGGNMKFYNTNNLELQGQKPVVFCDMHMENCTETI